MCKSNKTKQTKPPIKISLKPYKKYSCIQNGKYPETVSYFKQLRRCLAWQMDKLWLFFKATIYGLIAKSRSFRYCMSTVKVYLQLWIACLHQKKVTEVKLPETEEHLQQYLLILKEEKEDKPSLTTFFFNSPLPVQPHLCPIHILYCCYHMFFAYVTQDISVSLHCSKVGFILTSKALAAAAYMAFQGQTEFD